MLTWFAHDLPEHTSVSRLFDALLCGPSLLALYVGVAGVLRVRKSLLLLNCEFSEVHSFLSGLFSRGPLSDDPQALDHCVRDGLCLLRAYPPVAVSPELARSPFVRERLPWKTPELMLHVGRDRRLYSSRYAILFSMWFVPLLSMLIYLIAVHYQSSTDDQLEL